MRPFASEETIHEETYQHLMTASINEVLAERGIAGSVRVEDVAYLAHQGYHVAQACGFDPAEMPKDAHVRLVEFLRSTDRISESERDVLLAFIVEAEAGRPAEISQMPVATPESPAFSRYRQVAAASRALWPELVPTETPAPGDGRTTHRNIGEDVFRWGFEYFIDAAYAALIGGLAGYVVGAYYSGMVHLAFIALDRAEGGSGGSAGDPGCPCCLCAGP
jgi:hypothetical protein